MRLARRAVWRQADADGFARGTGFPIDEQAIFHDEA